MITLEKALEALKTFSVDEETLLSWEEELGLFVPVDEYGRKQYSPHHINLFKNVKKHLALGRSLEEIKSIITPPPFEAGKAQASLPEMADHPQKSLLGSSLVVHTQDPLPIAPSSPYASVPQHPFLGKKTEEARLIDLVNKLIAEKDQLHKKLSETEKLNSHLYNANNMFHRKLKEMEQETAQMKALVQQLQRKLADDKSLQMLDEKNQIQKKFLDLEKAYQHQKQDLEATTEKLTKTHTTLEQLHQEFQQALVNPSACEFVGYWLETGQLLEVMYDNFGMNIEPQRKRYFKITEKPTRTFGRTGVMSTYYEYDSNPLWKRNEMLFLSPLSPDRLEGELIAEYILDGVPVAKALYRVSYERRSTEQNSTPA